MMTAKLGSDRQRWNPSGEWWHGGPLPEHEAITESFSMGLLSQQSSYCFHSLVKYILDVQSVLALLCSLFRCWKALLIAIKNRGGIRLLRMATQSRK